MPLLALVSDESFASAVPEIPRTEDGVRKYLERKKNVALPAEGECFDLVVELRDSGTVVGLVTLVLRPDREGSIGYALGSEHRGRGYATEASHALLDWAFSELGLRRVWADTEEENAPSRAVMERLGMRRERPCSGEPRDLRVVYALIVDDWLRLHRRVDTKGSDG